MELYAKVLRQFRTVFLHQEHMNTFKTYDSQDVSSLLFAVYKANSWRVDIAFSLICLLNWLLVKWFEQVYLL